MLLVYQMDKPSTYTMYVPLLTTRLWFMTPRVAEFWFMWLPEVIFSDWDTLLVLYFLWSCHELSHVAGLPNIFHKVRVFTNLWLRNIMYCLYNESRVIESHEVPSYVRCQSWHRPYCTIRKLIIPYLLPATYFFPSYNIM